MRRAAGGQVPVIFQKLQGRWVARPSLRTAGALEPAGADSGAWATLLDGAAWLAPVKASGRETLWALLLHAEARVLHNGQPVSAGLRLLAHRDALALEGQEPLFFSTEEAASVEPLAGPDQVVCPRCRDAVAPGEPAVRCPACGVVHHETGERNCWTYAAACALCPQPTALDAGLQWTPEGL